MDVLEVLRLGGYLKVALVALEGGPDHPTAGTRVRRSPNLVSPTPKPNT